MYSKKVQLWLRVKNRVYLCASNGEIKYAECSGLFGAIVCEKVLNIPMSISQYSQSHSAKYAEFCYHWLD